MVMPWEMEYHGVTLYLEVNPQHRACHLMMADSKRAVFERDARVKTASSTHPSTATSTNVFLLPSLTGRVARPSFASSATSPMSRVFVAALGTSTGAVVRRAAERGQIRTTAQTRLPARMHHRYGRAPQQAQGAETVYHDRSLDAAHDGAPEDYGLGAIRQGPRHPVPGAVLRRIVFVQDEPGHTVYQAGDGAYEP
ncbi:hypothetical protein PSPO01_10413 [Paraphaeosphaeria sporulosa]